jgi:hypothetical protein
VGRRCGRCGCGRLGRCIPGRCSRGHRRSRRPRRWRRGRRMGSRRGEDLGVRLAWRSPRVLRVRTLRRTAISGIGSARQLAGERRAEVLARDAGVRCSEPDSANPRSVIVRVSTEPGVVLAASQDRLHRPVRVEAGKIGAARPLAGGVRPNADGSGTMRGCRRGWRGSPVPRRAPAGRLGPARGLPRVRPGPPGDDHIRIGGHPNRTNG